MDSKISKLKMLLAEPTTLKLLIFILVSQTHFLLCFRKAEKRGVPRVLPFRALTPRCSAIREASRLVVRPKYSDAGLVSAQLNLYTTRERRPNGRESLNLKREPMV